MSATQVRKLSDKNAQVIWTHFTYVCVFKTKMASCTSATEVRKLSDKIYKSWDTIHIRLCRRRWFPVRQLHQSGSFRIKNPEIKWMKIGSCTSVMLDMKHS